MKKRTVVIAAGIGAAVLSGLSALWQNFANTGERVVLAPWNPSVGQTARGSQKISDGNNSKYFSDLSSKTNNETSQKVPESVLVAHWMNKAQSSSATSLERLRYLVKILELTEGKFHKNPEDYGLDTKLFTQLMQNHGRTAIQEMGGVETVLGRQYTNTTDKVNALTDLAKAAYAAGLTDNGDFSREYAEQLLGGHENMDNLVGQLNYALNTAQNEALERIQERLKNLPDDLGRGERDSLFQDLRLFAIGQSLSMFDTLGVSSANAINRPEFSYEQSYRGYELYKELQRRINQENVPEYVPEERYILPEIMKKKPPLLNIIGLIPLQNNLS